jgi:hypothetical protein
MADCEPEPRRIPDWLRSWRFWRWVGFVITVVSAGITVWRWWAKE